MADRQKPHVWFSQGKWLCQGPGGFFAGGSTTPIGAYRMHMAIVAEQRRYLERSLDQFMRRRING